MKTLAIGVLGFVLLSGCGSDDDSGSVKALETMGMLGVPSPTLIGQNVMLVDATLNGHPGGRLLVDTGSPLTLMNAAFFTGAMLAMQAQTEVDVGLGALTIDSVPVLQITGGAMDRLRLAGILGGNVLRQFPTNFNYRDRQFQIGGMAMPSDVAPATVIPFKLSGGGEGTLNGKVIRYLATRVPLKVSVEGKEYQFVLDTGASDVTLRSSVFDTLIADGRHVIDDMPISTVLGPSKARVARARSVAVGSEIVTDIPVLSFEDSILDAMSNELGYTVDGLLGGDYLREFSLTVDYPAGRVELSRYANRAHIVDEFKRVGFWLASSGATTFAVSSVCGDSAAEKLGVSVGDAVVSIEGQPLDGLDIFAVDALLNGAPGSSHRIGFGQTREATLANTEVMIPVEDLVRGAN
ncbi:MAG: aspartyl protease family protein [Myxococcota bacterium]